MVTKTSNNFSNKINEVHVSTKNYLSRGFIASARTFNLLTRAFNHATHTYRLPTRGSELVTRGFELVTCNSQLLFYFSTSILEYK